MTETQHNLLRLLAHALFHVPTMVTVTDEIITEARAQAVNSFIICDYKTISQNIRVLNAHAQLTGLLSGIPFTTFKGYASAYYYPQPSNRTMGDVDFIVGSSDYEKTVDRLLTAGYIEHHSKHVRHKGFYYGKVELELHSEIKGIPNGADGIVTDSITAGKKVRGLLADLIETARIVETQQGPVIIPDDFHHGLIMLLHIAGHMINNGGVGLRHLCDWAVYVDRVNVSQFKDKFKSVGLWTFACQLTAVCSRYLGLPKQPWTGVWSNAFLEELIEDFLAAGNFGRKETGRTVTMVLERSSLAEMTRKRFPKATSATLPFFMVVYLARYGWLVLIGKRRAIKFSTIIRAKKRNALYQQFQLFEV